MFMYEIWGFDGSENLRCGLLGWEAVLSFRQLSTLQREVLPPSPAKQLLSINLINKSITLLSSCGYFLQHCDYDIYFYSNNCTDLKEFPRLINVLL
jgi:hypothetical protein